MRGVAICTHCRLPYFSVVLSHMPPCEQCGATLFFLGRETPSLGETSQPPQQSVRTHTLSSVSPTIMDLDALTTLTHHPDDRGALMYMVANGMQSHDYVGAWHYATRLLTLEPSSQVMRWVGECGVLGGLSQKTIECLFPHISQEQDAWVHLWMGVAYADLGYLGHAKWHFDCAIAGDDSNGIVSQRAQRLLTERIES